MKAAAAKNRLLHASFLMQPVRHTTSGIPPRLPPRTPTAPALTRTASTYPDTAHTCPCATPTSQHPTHAYLCPTHFCHHTTRTYPDTVALHHSHVPSGHSHQPPHHRHAPLHAAVKNRLPNASFLMQSGAPHRPRQSSATFAAHTDRPFTHTYHSHVPRHRLYVPLHHSRLIVPH